MSAYPFDPSSASLLNKIVGEIVPLTFINIRYKYIIPAAAPFFSKELIIKHTNNSGVSRILRQGIDYNLVFPYYEATVSLNKEVYGGIQFLDIAINGNVTLVYQTVGGIWVPTLAEVLSKFTDVATTPVSTLWESVLQSSNVFPSGLTTWDYSITPKIKEVISELSSAGISVQLRPSLAKSPRVGSVFIPTKDEVGLANVDNFRTATAAETITGTSGSLFVTPLGVKTAFNLMQTELITKQGLATAGANSNITSLTGLTTPLSIAQGGTGGLTAAAALTALGAAKAGPIHLSGITGTATLSDINAVDATLREIISGLQVAITNLQNQVSTLL